MSHSLRLIRGTVAAACFLAGAALGQDSARPPTSPPPHATSQTTHDSFRNPTVPDGNTAVGGTAEGTAAYNQGPGAQPKKAKAKAPKKKSE